MNMDLVTHHQLNNRYVFQGELILESPLRISSGRADEKTDAPFMRDYNGTPYIPGTSLRGAIRSEVERVLAAVGKEAGFSGCTLFEPDSCDKVFKKIMEEMESRKPRPKEEEMNGRADRFVRKELCAVCKLFGATMYASRLTIGDALPAGDGAAVKSRVRDGVGIHRDNGAAVQGVKFDYEVIESAPGFEFQMRAENLADEDKRLISLILKLLKNGIYVGGKRAAGLGKIKLADDYTVRGFESPGELWAALESDGEIERKLEWKEVIGC